MIIHASFVIKCHVAARLCTAQRTAAPRRAAPPPILNKTIITGFFRHRQETVELIGALKLMKNKFPNSMEYSSKLALEYLKKRQFSKAITELTHIVERWPSQKSSKEKVLLQLALKWTEKSTKDEIKNVIKTCSTLSDIGQTVKELAEGYQRAGHIKEATFLYQEGATSGLFVSTWQRMIIDNDLFIQGKKYSDYWFLLNG